MKKIKIILKNAMIEYFFIGREKIVDYLYDLFTKQNELMAENIDYLIQKITLLQPKLENQKITNEVIQILCEVCQQKNEIIKNFF